jgi:murein DD-endopeptidase MepM/ murein hydrolase activator NlpD
MAGPATPAFFFALVRPLLARLTQVVGSRTAKIVLRDVLNRTKRATDPRRLKQLAVKKMIVTGVKVIAELGEDYVARGRIAGMEVEESFITPGRVSESSALISALSRAGWAGDYPVLVVIRIPDDAEVARSRGAVALTAVGATQAMRDLRLLVRMLEPYRKDPRYIFAYHLASDESPDKTETEPTPAVPVPLPSVELPKPKTKRVRTTATNSSSVDETALPSEDASRAEEHLRAAPILAAIIAEEPISTFAGVTRDMVTKWRRVDPGSYVLELSSVLSNPEAAIKERERSHKTGMITDIPGSVRTSKDGRLRYHLGVDLGVPPGTKIIAPAEMEVTATGPDWVLIYLPAYELSLWFTHLKVAVRKDQVGRRALLPSGTLLGSVILAGTGPHLHLEAYIGRIATVTAARSTGRTLNPLAVLAPDVGFKSSDHYLVYLRDGTRGLRASDVPKLPVPYWQKTAGAAK